ncbi:hypothetical protein SeLEV6574_g02060 [Synchytrium endobioticum]|uniref:Uncharacterized protein n=1 Tax=Synchytrium endobioticum TaxID=286115 RepID=A0A507DA06_9FUNG|nr:hypothetical protein SeLEV6574_g02060 [Synchytrium endobioticum]
MARINDESRRWRSTIAILLLWAFYPVINSFRFDMDDDYYYEPVRTECDSRAKIEGIWTNGQDVNDAIKEYYEWETNGRHACLASLASDVYKRGQRLSEIEPAVYSGNQEGLTRLVKRQVDVITDEDTDDEEDSDMSSSDIEVIDSNTLESSNSEEDAVSYGNYGGLPEVQALSQAKTTLQPKAQARYDVTGDVVSFARPLLNVAMDTISTKAVAAGKPNTMTTSSSGNSDMGQSNLQPSSAQRTQPESSVKTTVMRQDLSPLTVAATSSTAKVKQVLSAQTSTVQPSPATAGHSQVPLMQSSAVQALQIKIQSTQVLSTQPSTTQVAPVSVTSGNPKIGDQGTPSAQVNLERRSPAPANAGQAGNGGNTGNPAGGNNLAAPQNPPTRVQPSADKPVAQPSAAPVVVKPSDAAPSPVLIKPSPDPIQPSAAPVEPSAAPATASQGPVAPQSPPDPSAAPPVVVPHPSPDTIVVPYPSPDPVVVAQPSPDPVQPSAAPVVVAPEVPASPQVAPILPSPLVQIVPAFQAAPSPDSNSNGKGRGGNNGDGNTAKGGSGAMVQGSGNRPSPTATLLRTQTMFATMTSISTQLDQTSDPISIAKGPILGVVIFVAVALAAFGLYVFIRISRRRGWRFARNGFRASRPIPVGFFKPVAEY